jgi:hypothetical protein
VKIASDVERLMWLAAESGDPAAIADFESRFPALKYELAKRIEMVRALKASGKQVRQSSRIPQFRATVPRPAPIGPRIRWTVAAVALSALAFGSFYATRELIRHRHVPAPPTVADTNPEAQPETLSPDLQAVNPEEQITELPETPPGLQQPDDEPPAGPKWDRPLTIRLTEIGLVSALRAIADQSGLEIVIPPDLPDDPIEVDYRQALPLEILRDMGERFGFAAFDQGGGQVIVVPAKNESGVPSPSDPAWRPEGHDRDRNVPVSKTPPNSG